MVARCQRCAATLRWARRDALPRAAACALAAAFLFVLALVLPFLRASAAGQAAATTLWTGPEVLRNEGSWELAVVVAVTLLLVPAVKIALLLTALVAARAAHPPRWLPWLLATLERLGPWAMLDVFVLGTFVAYTRIRALAQVDIGPGCFALGGAMLALAAADASLDRDALREKLEAAGVGRARDAAHARAPQSISRAWAYLVAGAVLYVPANALPVMTFTKLGRGGAVTILGGIQELFSAGIWPLGVLVFVASFVVPLLKLVGLATMLLMTQRGSRRALVARTRAVRLTRFIGRWSMIDVFALTTLVALVHMGFVAQVLPDVGAVAFCGVVVMTMLATDFFDPRLMWDAAGFGPEAAAS